MLINDLIGMLMEVPAKLAAGWAAWFFVGLILSIWGRREKAYLVVHKHKSGVRAAAGSKPPSGVRAPVRASKNVPVSSGDAFGELERLLEPESPTHRTPGDSPMLSENPPEPALAAPQSLP